MTHTLTVTKTGAGSGSVVSTPAGVDCGATCTSSQEGGTALTLQATASVGSVFAGRGGACTGMGACVVTLDADTAVTADFGRADSTCETPGGRLTAGPYIVDNNTYMNTQVALPAHPLSTFSQCARLDPGSTSGTVKTTFTWSWPEPASLAERVTRATPSIIYGFNPWDPGSTTPDLPRLVTAIRRLQVDADVAQTVSSNENSLFGLVAYLTTTDHKTGSEPLPFQKRLLIYPNVYPPYPDHGSARSPSTGSSGTTGRRATTSCTPPTPARACPSSRSISTWPTSWRTP
jgi:hypothetical protein